MTEAHHMISVRSVGEGEPAIQGNLFRLCYDGLVSTEFSGKFISSCGSRYTAQSDILYPTRWQHVANSVTCSCILSNVLLRADS